MDYSKAIKTLRAYSHSIGGPASTLGALKFLSENKSGMSAECLKMYDFVRNWHVKRRIARVENGDI